MGERSGCDADQREEAASITKTTDANPLYFNIYSKLSSTILSSSSSSLATLHESSQSFEWQYGDEDSNALDSSTPQLDDKDFKQPETKGSSRETNIQDIVSSPVDSTSKVFPSGTAYRPRWSPSAVKRAGTQESVSSQAETRTVYRTKLGPSRESDLTGKLFVVRGGDIEDMVNEDLEDIAKEEDTVEEYLTLQDTVEKKDTVEEYLTLQDAVTEPLEDTVRQDLEDTVTQEPLQYFVKAVLQDSIKEALQEDQSLQDNDQPLESLVEGVDASTGKVLDDWVTSVCAQTLVEPEPHSRNGEELQDLPRKAGSKSNGISSFAARNWNDEDNLPPLPLAEPRDESFAKHSGESLKASAGHWSDAIISGRKGGPRRFVFDSGRVFT